MGFRRALTLAMVAAWGLGTQTISARADGVPADDYVPYEPSGFFVFDWSGFYAGGHLGIGHTNAESTEATAQSAEVIDSTDVIVDPFVPIVFAPLNYDQSETSATGGLQIGWQRQWGKLVGGVEAGFTLLRFDTTSESPLLPGLFRSAEVRDIFTLTGRLGYAEGRWLAYAKGGVVNAAVDIGYRDTVTGATTSSDGRETGWTAGIGIDYALAPNLFLGVEYNYLNFRADVVPPPIPDTQFGDVDVDIQNVVVRLNYRFGSACCIGPGGSNRW